MSRSEKTDIIGGVACVALFMAMWIGLFLFAGYKDRLALERYVAAREASL